MTRPTDETLLAFLEGRLEEPERSALLDQLDADPALARELRQAAAGLHALPALADEPVPLASRLQSSTPSRRVPLWWIAAAAAITVAISVPATRWFDRVPAGPTLDVESASAFALGQPADPAPSFVLVLHRTWPDATTIDREETVRRAEEYWNWTSSLAEEGRLVAAGDLRWEPGRRLRSDGTEVTVAPAVVGSDDFLVGMFAIRAGSYEEARAIASESPHLRYGGSVSVRQVGGGFVTVPGMGDWEG